MVNKIPGYYSMTILNPIKNEKWFFHIEPNWVIDWWCVPNLHTIQNILDLLETIKIITHDFGNEKYLLLSIHNANSVSYHYRQGSLLEYL